MINPDHPSPSLVEVLGRLGADAVFVDCEHGNYTYERIEDMVRAAHLTGMAVILRPDSDEAWRLTRYLARGIDGLMVPHVETVQQARKIVDALKNALPTSAENIILIPMLESVQALEHLSEIVAMREVDAVFCGSGDLAKSMGHTNKLHPEVRAKVNEVMARIAAGGKAPGRMVRPTDLQDCVESGARLLYIHANELLGLATQKFIEQVRESGARAG
jgi:4-hydroxy-2-oxoheptanedioate aldolase